MRLSPLKLMTVAAIVAMGAATVPVGAAEPTAVGLWEQVDESSGKAESWFKITERSGVYVVCDTREGSEKGAPVLGLALIKGMQRNGLTYENGTIMDPRDGSVYRALMKLSPDGQKLEVRGYLGISLFGRSQVWKRLPDNALGPQARPAKGAAQKKQ
jgi:uncharacterized protein (DUF2147 family)